MIERNRVAAVALAPRQASQLNRPATISHVHHPRQMFALYPKHNNFCISAAEALGDGWMSCSALLNSRGFARPETMTPPVPFPAAGACSQQRDLPRNSYKRGERDTPFLRNT
ncbi:hypothetical protein GEV33_002886 [Tenebrio molitor]|uniref:Uncharacterized protein n=1 Tax=Tenebrio molitor TaxID=7067 RepID=A0A8J6LFP1_TENMO|nr:hypothetical protein GEV33_002886 [Tenebrio molitor]